MGDAGIGLLIAGIALAAVGTGVSTYAAVEQGKAQKEAAKYNEDVAENNAVAARQQSAFEAERVRRRNIKILGSQRAAAAKSGVLLSGSVSDVIAESSQQGEMDRLATLYTGAISSNRSSAESKLFGLQASNATRQANLAAGGTLISGLGGAASSSSQAYTQYQANKKPAPVFGEN